MPLAPVEPADHDATTDNLKAEVTARRTGCLTPASKFQSVQGSLAEREVEGTSKWARCARSVFRGRPFLEPLQDIDHATVAVEHYRDAR